jgi:[ribosomal protein S5]-alanine N-acetyltransferase
VARTVGLRMGAPHLTDGRVTVRGLRSDDIPLYLEAFAEGDALLNLLGYEEPPDREWIEGWLDERWVDPPELESWEFVVADGGSDRFLGTMMLHSCDWRHRRAEVGAWMTADARGRGLGSAAFGLLLDWAFDDAGLERIEITALPENVSIPHIAATFGFTYEGTLRKRNFERGRRVDLLIWGLLRDEWLRR